MPGAQKVGVEDVVSAAFTLGEHRGLRGALHDRPQRTDGLQISLLTDVAVDELDSRRAQTRKVELRAPPAQVVERHHTPLGPALGQGDADVGPDEAGASRYEDAVAHGQTASAESPLASRCQGLASESAGMSTRTENGGLTVPMLIGIPGGANRRTPTLTGAGPRFVTDAPPVGITTASGSPPESVPSFRHPAASGARAVGGSGLRAIWYPAARTLSAACCSSGGAAAISCGESPSDP